VRYDSCLDKKKGVGEIALRKVVLFVLNKKHRIVLNGYVTFQVGDRKIN
jgi:hypothetical protein